MTLNFYSSWVLGFQECATTLGSNVLSTAPKSICSHCSVYLLRSFMDEMPGSYSWEAAAGFGLSCNMKTKAIQSVLIRSMGAYLINLPLHPTLLKQTECLPAHSYLIRGVNSSFLPKYLYLVRTSLWTWGGSPLEISAPQWIKSFLCFSFLDFQVWHLGPSMCGGTGVCVCGGVSSYGSDLAL